MGVADGTGGTTPTGGTATAAEGPGPGAGGTGMAVNWLVTATVLLPSVVIPSVGDPAITGTDQVYPVTALGKVSVTMQMEPVGIPPMVAN